jgi:DNA polymerase III epsilon subunit-like protein
MSNPLTVIWVDTETTGKETKNSGAFEIAMLVYQGNKILDEKVFNLNPLTEKILFSEEAYNVNGVPEETIRSFPPAEKVMPEIAEFLKKYTPEEKLVFAGYNCKFDYEHVEALMSRCGLSMTNYFNAKLIDVYERVKKAASMGLLPKTENQRLGTMTKALGIVHEGAHSALSDIKATRRLYEVIYMIERSKRV